MLYNERIERIELSSYKLKPINTVKLVHHNYINYLYKYEDRTELTSLYHQRGAADDIIIIKKGFLTDSYYANIALKYRDGLWYTPLNPLLKGTKRQYLIDHGALKVREISIDNVFQYEELCLFNSMIEMGEVTVPMSNIQYN